jgi:hypothetical protein
VFPVPVAVASLAIFLEATLPIQHVQGDKKYTGWETQIIVTLKLKECMNLISGVRCISLAGGCTKG